MDQHNGTADWMSKPQRRITSEVMKELIDTGMVNTIDAVGGSKAVKITEAGLERVRCL